MGTGYEQISAAEMRQALISAGMSIEDVNNIKGKGNLAYELIQRQLTPEKIIQIVEDDEKVPDLSDIELDDEIDGVATDVGDYLDGEEKRLEKNSPDWHDYVMSLFQEDELDKGYPKLVGLRRVANKLFGDFEFSGAVDLLMKHPDNPNDPGRATCIYEIRVVMSYDTKGNPIQVQSYRGVGGSYVGNTDDNFAIYPEVMAENRAEARALRNLLGLKVCTAEETSGKSFVPIVQEITSTEWLPTDKLSEQQKVHICTKCKILGIDANKFANLGNEEGNYVEDIGKITRERAVFLIKELNQYQGGQEIPKEILV